MITPRPISHGLQFNAAARFAELLVGALEKMPEFKHVSALTFEPQIGPSEDGDRGLHVSRFLVTSKNGSFSVECSSGAAVGLMTTVTLVHPQPDTLGEYRFGGSEPSPSCLGRVVSALGNVLRVVSTQPISDEFTDVVMPPRFQGAEMHLDSHAPHEFTGGPSSRVS
jgi:hypothetical protein